MRKKYYSDSQVTIVVPIGEGYKRIAFDAHTSHGSTLYVDDEALQKAIEKHPRFGELFLLQEMPIDPVVKPKKEKKVKTGPKVIKVPCAEDARDYLATNFGESRTKMRSIAAIKIVAAMNKVVFDCPELEEPKEETKDEPKEETKDEGQNP